MTSLRRSLVALAWALPLALFVFAITRDWTLSQTQPGFGIDGQTLWGRDFVNVYSSGVLAVQGKLDLLYDVPAYQAWQSAYFAPASITTHNYSYPPISLFYTWLFPLLPYPVAAASWLGLTGAAFVAAARPYLRDAGAPALAALILPACLVNIWAGHYGFLIGALWLAAWNQLGRRPLLAGVLIGLLVVKPHLAILAPLVLAWRREWRAFAAAAVTLIALVAASALAFGPELWRVYVTETAGYQTAMIDDVRALYLWMMPTVTPALALLGLPTNLALGVQGLIAIGAVAALLRWLPADNRAAGLATGVATFLVLPYAFAYDMTVASVAAVAVLAAARAWRPAWLLLAVFAFAAPAVLIFLNGAGLPIAPLLTAFLLGAYLWLNRPAVPAAAAAARSVV